MRDQRLEGGGIRAEDGGDLRLLHLGIHGGHDKEEEEEERGMTSEHARGLGFLIYDDVIRETRLAEHSSLERGVSFVCRFIYGCGVRECCVVVYCHNISGKRVRLPCTASGAN